MVTPEPDVSQLTVDLGPGYREPLRLQGAVEVGPTQDYSLTNRQMVVGYR